MVFSGLGLWSVFGWVDRGLACDYVVEVLPERIGGVLRVWVTQVAAWVAAVVKARVGQFKARLGVVGGLFHSVVRGYSMNTLFGRLAPLSIFSFCSWIARWASISLKP